MDSHFLPLLTYSFAVSAADSASAASASTAAAA
jgi:hypothetical protein